MDEDWATALNNLSGGQDIRWRVMGDTEIRIGIDRHFSMPRPIVTVDDRTIGTGKPGPVTMKLLEAFRTAARSG